MASIFSFHCFYFSNSGSIFADTLFELWIATAEAEDTATRAVIVEEEAAEDTATKALTVEEAAAAAADTATRVPTAEVDPIAAARLAAALPEAAQASMPVFTRPPAATSSECPTRWPTR